MQLGVFSALLLLVAGGCSAQRPQPCRTPPLLQGKVTVSSQKLEFDMIGKYVYDAIGQRIRIGEIGHEKNQTFNQDFLLLFKEGVIFVIDEAKQTCEKQKLTGSFQPMQIPSDAKFWAQVVLGSLAGPGQGLLANSWIGEIPEDKAKYILSYTEFGCLPISSLYKAPQTDWILTTFFDIVLGIEDPGKLMVPDFCLDAAVETEKEGDFFSVFF
ncbi:ependymin-like 1 [Trichomycterus rosablanca]|uniref:ependymin-like 1 n=1 Tax=Trichomycterus rosablanca TaxID=2290929 RepID=UPI002F356D3E